MRILSSNSNVDNSDLANYPDGRLKDNNGSGNGTAVNERTNGDLFQTISRLMRLGGIVPNNEPDNVSNGFQIVEALIQLASKNDYILPLTVASGVMQVPLKLALVKDNESFICKVNFNYSTETQIKGIDATLFSITVNGGFLANEYVRLIKTSLGIVVVRLADNVSLNDMVSELLYLKKASYLEEIAGSSNFVATTPQSNSLAFAERVNGLLSSVSLANAIRNGLYPKEHFSIVAGLQATPVKNVGWFSGVNVGGGSGSLAVSGNFTAANSVTTVLNTSKVTVTMQNAMTNLNYYVRIYFQGEGSIVEEDTTVLAPIFKPLSTTQFLVSLRENGNFSQSLKVHCEVVQL